MGLILLSLVFVQCASRKVNVDRFKSDSTGTKTESLKTKVKSDSSRVTTESGESESSIEFEFDSSTTELDPVKIAEISKDGVITITSTQRLKGAIIKGKAAYVKTDSTGAKSTAKIEQNVKQETKQTTEQKVKQTESKKPGLVWFIVAFILLVAGFVIYTVTKKSKP